MRNKVGGLTHPGLKACHEVTVSNGVWYQHAAKDVNVEKNGELINKLSFEVN